MARCWLPTATALRQVPAGAGSAPGTGAALCCSKEGVNLTEGGAVPTAGPPPVPAASPLIRRMHWDRDRWAGKKLSYTNALYRSIERTCWETDPPFTAQSSKALRCVASRDTRGGEWREAATGTPGAVAVHQACPSLPSTLGGSWGREPALLGCFKPLGFLCGAEEGMSHARTKPWGPGDARQPRIEEIFHDKLSQPGHACHLVERPGDSGRDPKPRSPGPEAEAREFPIVANPKPGTPQKSGRGLTVQ